MAKLPRSIIKKYGISKKAWSVFRHGSTGGKMARHRSFKSHKMARRSSGGIFGGSIVGTSTNSLVQVDAIAYGAARQYVANLISPLTNSLPLGAYADEVGMGLVDWLLAKNVKGFVGDIARKGLVHENARIGEQLIGNLGGMATSNTGLSSYNSGFSY